MATAYKNGAGTLTTSNVTLYTCPASTVAIVNMIAVSNIDTSLSHTVTLSVTMNSVTKVLYPAVVVTPNGVLSSKPEIQLYLNAGDTISALADAGSVMNYVLTITELS